MLFLITLQPADQRLPTLLEKKKKMATISRREFCKSSKRGLFLVKYGKTSIVDSIFNKLAGIYPKSISGQDLSIVTEAAVCPMQACNFSKTLLPQRRFSQILPRFRNQLIFLSASICVEELSFMQDYMKVSPETRSNILKTDTTANASCFSNCWDNICGGTIYKENNRRDFCILQLC